MQLSYIQWSYSSKKTDLLIQIKYLVDPPSAGQHFISLDFNANVLSSPLHLNLKDLLWMYNRSAQFVFQLDPYFLPGVEV